MLSIARGRAAEVQFCVERNETIDPAALTGAPAVAGPARCRYAPRPGKHRHPDRRPVGGQLVAERLRLRLRHRRVHHPHSFQADSPAEMVVPYGSVSANHWWKNAGPAAPVHRTTTPAAFPRPP